MSHVTYDDQCSAAPEKLIAVAPNGQLCQSPVFKSIKESIVPGLLRSSPEDIFSISLQEHKIGIIVKDSEHVPSMLLQVELNSVRAKSKPLNMGDVNQLKLMMMIIFERLQKFKILSQEGKGPDGLSEIIKVIMKTSRHESHKVLCRSLQEDLAVMDECAHVNVLFEDRGSGQLYTIAFTEDDDYRNTS